MRILSGKDVLRLLSSNEAIKIIEKQMVSVSNGDCTLPLRNVFDVGNNNKFGVMPGTLGVGKSYGAKILSLFPKNPAKGISSHVGLVIIFDPETGIPAAAINADALTALRTAAASAVATKYLAKENASTLTIIGTGEQAEYHIGCIPLVRLINKINLVGTTKEKAMALAEKMSKKFPSINFELFEKGNINLSDSDIVCTVTSSQDPVIFGDYVSAGTHINAVGASIPSHQEIDLTLIKKANLFVDYKPSVLAQAKDIMTALEKNLIKDTSELTEIGKVIQKITPGRIDENQITIYRSMGISAQDLSCASYVLEKAMEREVGIEASIL